ncbi:MAG: LPS export ABC transporter permease LptG [Gammaproteobacteria bacterium]|nr:MAG: LPS export ABC transporter permease LptG [Gammaproteobacteria bacterium]
MEILDRYIRNHILGALVGVLIVIVGLDLLAAFIAELEELKGNYQQLQAVTYVLNTIPGRVYEFVPVAALVGCLIGMGSLANGSELLVIRAAGVSIGRVVWSALKPTLAVAFLSVLLGEYVVPVTEQYAQGQRSAAMGRDGLIKTKSGIWHREGNEFVRIDAVGANGVLLGVTRYRFDSNQSLISTTVSRQAVYEDNHWRLTDTYITQFDKNNTKVRYSAEQDWFIQLSPESVSVVVLKPENMSISELYQYKNYLQAQTLDADQYAIAFWKKVFQPAIMVAMILVALSFIFGPLRSVTVGFRVVVGIVVGLGFQQGQDLFNYAAIVYHFDPLVAVAMPVVFCFAAGFVLLNRLR